MAVAILVASTSALGLNAAGLAGAAGLNFSVNDTSERVDARVGDGVASAVVCEETTVTAPVVADTWLDENSPSSGKGTDSVLSVDAGSVNVDTGDVSGRARALLRFAMPGAVPDGCVVESARLLVFSSEGSVGTRVEALRLASPWSENAASWSNQPGTTGAATRTWSRDGYMQWNVTEQVQAMLDSGSGHGFLLRDAAEGAETGGGGHGFYSREKGDSGTEAELVIRFAAPGSDEPPGLPLPPDPAAVSCGQVLTQSTLVTNDLSGCLGDGLVVGAPRIIVDLGGHTIDGTGLGSGIRNEGHAQVTVRNGTVQDFDYGVELYPETTANLVENLTLRLNQVAAVELFDVSATEVRGNRLDGNGGGILFVSGTRDSVAADNTITDNGGAGLLVQDATGNRLERNSVAGGGDLGIGLERASGNTLVGNTSSSNSDGGIEIHAASHDNRIEANTVVESGDHGILVSESDRNELVDNVAHRMSDSGITLDAANDSVVRGNDVRFNTGGLQLDGSSGNVLESNDASETSGIGIELGGGSMENVLDANIADANGAQGIYVSDDATDPLGNPVPGLGNLILANTASRNRADGIVAAKGGHTITANVTRDNLGWGINAALNSIDGSGNVAVGNGKPEQCMGVACKEEWVPPETEITDSPAPFTRSTSAQFSFTGSDDTSPVTALRFACSLDGGPFVACSSPALYTSLADGAHTFAVRATDALDNTDPTPATYQWTIDGTPPDTAITEAPADPSNQTPARFRFTGSDNASADTELAFECRLDRAPAWAACASPADLADLAEGAHTFEVRAVDGAGNADASPASHTWTIDTTPPDTAIVSGPALITNQRNATFDLSAEPGATFACSLDGAAFVPCATSTTYVDLSDGEHTFEARATDRAGNVDVSPAGHSWTIDTVAPETTLGERPADPTNITIASFTFTAGEPGSFECSLDEAAFSPCVSPAGYADLAAGAHLFRVRATDAAGNTDGSPAAYGWTIDTTPPETGIDSGPVDPTNSRSADFAFSADEEGSFVCSLDGAPFAACSSPVSYEGLAEGLHVFDVRAIDLAGNGDPIPARAVWTIDLTPPETAIDTGPADPTSATSAIFEFSANESSSFECRLDEGAFAACSSPVEHRELGEGGHVFEVRATDAAGNVEAAAASFGWTVDLTSPETAIDALPPDPTNSSTATFGFSAGEEATFACSLDGTPFAACSSPTSYEGLAEGVHTFDVRAIDKAGNSDASPARATWAIDLTPPETAIDAKPADPTISTSARFEFSANEVSTFECRLDDGSFAACTSPAVYEGLAEGVRAFDVRAVDRAGNADPAPARATWRIDLTPPETTIEAQPSDPTSSSSASFEFSASEASSFECRLDGGLFAPCSSPAAYEGLAEGNHRFEVRATDLAGNVEPDAALAEWAIDLTPPETAINSRPADPSNSSSAAFSFSADEDGTFMCSLDGAPYAACSSPASYEGLGEGLHSFDVRAVDRAGNVDASPAAHSWTIDLTPPETAIDAGPADETASVSATFEFSANEPSSFECRLDGGSFAPCSSPHAYAGLAEGAHAFDVRAVDRVGNADPTPARFTWRIDLTPPVTAVDSGPADPTTSSSATFLFSADEPATFACSLDGAPFAACSSPQAYENLSEGPHSFEVRATDRSGNSDATPGAHAWTIDRTAPETTITSGPPDPTNQRSASLSFSSDEPGSTFACSLDGAPLESCGSPASFTDLEPGAHTFRVLAIDRAGNADASPALRSWTIDLTEPETAIDSAPSDPSGSSTAVFAFSADEPASFECRLDGGPFGACSSPQAYVLEEGGHAFDVRAVDAAGNVDQTPARHSWTIDLAAPQTTIESGPADPTNSTAASFVFSADEAGATFACSLDGAPFAPCTSPTSYAGLSEGAHELRVQATDSLGNADPTPAAYAWVVDLTAPETAIDSGPGMTASTSATIAFSASEGGSTFECSLDGGPFASCASPAQYVGLATGTHEFLVRATDRAGNADQTPASHVWVIDLTPPQTAIESGPPDPTASSAAAFAFSADEPASFECRLDGGSFAACSSPQAYAGLAEGSHSFEVRAVDQAGNPDPSPAGFTWRVDQTAPETQIDSGPEATTTSTNASFAFSANEAVATFECSLDGAAFAACSSPRELEGLAFGGHEFRVQATDAAGNADGTPAIYSWTIEPPPDTTLPETTIDSAPSALSSSAAASFSFSSSKPGSTFACSLDGGAFAACTSPRQYTGLADGAHVFRVQATDAAGNADPTPAAHSWTIDTVAPETTIGAAPPALTSSTSASFSFSASEPGSTFECALDAGAFEACSSPRVYSGLAAGAHQFRVRARDAAGNVDATPAPYLWTIDNVAPETTISAAPPALTSSTSASFAFSASEAGSTFECSLDGAAFAACSSPRQYTGLAGGAHQFRVRAVDAVANVDPTPATYAWTVDVTPPQTVIDSGPAAATTSTSASFAFSSSEAGSTFECSLDGAAFAACSSPRQYTGLAVGAHQFRVRARDAAGNVDPTPATHDWTISAPTPSCSTPVTLSAAADAWLDENSSSTNKGSDSILKVQSKGPRDNFRALVRFPLPPLPPGCVLDRALLRLYAASMKPDRVLQAARIVSAWVENGVSWSNQPQTTGPSATTTSGFGYREWDVSDQAKAMLADGVSHGFLIRDAVEGQDAEQQFHSREKGESIPQLVVRFAAGG